MMEQNLVILFTIFLLHNNYFALSDNYDYDMKNFKMEYPNDYIYIDKIYNRMGEVNENHLDCKDKMCTNVPDYPQKDIKYLIEKNNISPTYFGTVFRPDKDPISVRFGSEPTECCQSRMGQISPQKFNGSEDFVVNIDGYFQTITYEVCHEPDTIKDSICGVYYLNHDYKCVQKYTEIQLLVMDSQKKDLMYKPFGVPSACAMKVLSYYK